MANMEDIRGTLFLILTFFVMGILSSSVLQLLNIEGQNQNLLSTSKFKEFKGKFSVQLIFSVN